jgi:protocatechuate 3,4-dioxygenase beta subunit
MVDLFAEAERRRLQPTPPNELGPFYKANAPKIRDLRRTGDRGLPLSVSGEVLDTAGEALAGALVEVWHTDPHGQYDNSGFNYRAQMPSEDTGKYAFDTWMPGHYPDRVAQHIHYKISAPGHKTLVTQLYFATDPAFQGDPDKNYGKDPILHSRELIRPVMVYPEADSIRAAVNFQIVLEKA